MRETGLELTHDLIQLHLTAAFLSLSSPATGDLKLTNGSWICQYTSERVKRVECESLTCDVRELVCHSGN